tara:strand:- start:23108 stop:23227 length:120 start_codon:yes stop_codon:yes gene_type:complete
MLVIRAMEGIPMAYGSKMKPKKKKAPKKKGKKIGYKKVY